MHLNKCAKGFDIFTNGAAGGVVGRNRGADGNATVFGDLRGDIADSADVKVAVFFAEP